MPESSVKTSTRKLLINNAYVKNIYQDRKDMYNYIRGIEKITAGSFLLVGDDKKCWMKKDSISGKLHE